MLWGRTFPREPSRGPQLSPYLSSGGVPSLCLENSWPSLVFNRTEELQGSLITQLGYAPGPFVLMEKEKTPKNRLLGWEVGKASGPLQRAVIITVGKAQSNEMEMSDRRWEQAFLCPISRSHLHIASLLKGNAVLRSVLSYFGEECLAFYGCFNWWQYSLLSVLSLASLLSHVLLTTSPVLVLPHSYCLVTTLSLSRELKEVEKWENL